MSKAYDCIEWSFLKEVYSRISFHDVWIGWIMKCVSTVSNSFLINGSPQGLVTPSRGLRQGDSLSPYLCVLCTEVFSGMCRIVKDNRSLSGITDDTMFFCKSDTQSCNTLTEILRRYEEASSQFINLAKSSITFSSKTPRAC